MVLINSGISSSQIFSVDIGGCITSSNLPGLRFNVPLLSTLKGPFIVRGTIGNFSSVAI